MSIWDFELRSLLWFRLTIEGLKLLAVAMFASLFVCTNVLTYSLSVMLMLLHQENTVTLAPWNCTHSTLWCRPHLYKYFFTVR